MITPASRANSAWSADSSGSSVSAPRLGVGPHRGRRGEASGSCLMEYVSIFAGEKFSDLPGCTHPAVAVVAWRINDELCTATRQQLLVRAPTLVGAGRGLDRPVRPIVLDLITDAALALDSHHRYFQRLRRRLDRAPVAAAQDTGGRLATWWHPLAPVNIAMTHYLRAVYRHSAERNHCEQGAIALLDACLAATQPNPTRPAPAEEACRI